MITFEHFSFRYEERETFALQDIDLTIQGNSSC